MHQYINYPDNMKIYIGTRFDSVLTEGDVFQMCTEYDLSHEDLKDYIASSTIIVDFAISNMKNDF